MDGAPRGGATVPVSTAEPDPTAADLKHAPGDLVGVARQFWEDYAPQALAERTLTDATVPGFRELCEQYEFKDTVAQMLRAPQPGSDPDKLLRHYAKLSQRVDTSMARFRLTAMGKPIDTKGAAARQAQASPWAQIASK